MRYQNVCLEGLGWCLPEEPTTSSQLERQLQPLYQRLGLVEGRLELISGVRERRFWPVGTLPSEMSIRSGRQAIAASGLAAADLGAVIHASVCRDHLEPATACRVHHELGLSPECVAYDVSNACLGILTGMVQIANMIELGQIRAGLVVGTEGSRQLVETTVDALNADVDATRASIKGSLASLTTGSASVAVLLCDRRLSRTQNRILAATVRANTREHTLCQSGSDASVAAGMQPMMETQSERLLAEGIAVGEETFHEFLAESGWSRDQIDRTICHQVGPTHRRKMLEVLGLPLDRDFATVEWLGNTGAAALPITLALGVEQRCIGPGERLAMLGIGSGINCLMMAVDWVCSPADATTRGGQLAGQQHRGSRQPR